VGAFDEASIELVAWEFSLPVAAVSRAWRAAVTEQLIEPTGACPMTGETVWALSRAR
jgi:hypothetical protein